MNIPQKHTVFFAEATIDHLSDANQFKQSMIDNYGDIAKDDSLYEFRVGYDYDDAYVVCYFEYRQENPTYEQDLKAYQEYQFSLELEKLNNRIGVLIKKNCQ